MGEEVIIKKGVTALRLMATLLAVFSFVGCTVIITGLGKPVLGKMILGLY